jgi:hypothetical protein
MNYIKTQMTTENNKIIFLPFGMQQFHGNRAEIPHELFQFRKKTQQKILPASQTATIFFPGSFVVTAADALDK